MKPKTVGRNSGRTAATSPGESAGLLADSIILTLDGERHVHDIGPGQRVVTRDSGTATVKSVRRHVILTDAVRIMAGSLGDTRPDRDLILPAGQPVLVRDWRAQALFGAAQAMVPAIRLVDGEFITHLGPRPMTLCEIEFDRPHVLYVDGLEVAGHVARSTTAIAA